MVNESILVEQLKNTKTLDSAFRQLMTLYKERLYWHIRKIVLSHENADDVLQNTFVKVYKNIHKFNEKSKLYSWMYRIATNEAITFLNKEAKEKNIDITTIQHQLAENLQSDVYFNGDEIQLQLQKAIAALPQKQQIVFNMKYFDEMKYNDMSEILETSVGSLKASYHHAVKKIQNILTK